MDSIFILQQMEKYESCKKIKTKRQDVNNELFGCY